MAETSNSDRAVNVWSVLALVVGFVGALGLAAAAFAVSFCALWGEQCTAAEEQQMDLLGLGAWGMFLGVPILVAIVRHQARWLLAPVIEAALIVGFFLALDWF